MLERQYYSADVSAMIGGEKYDHQAYIYGYKVSTCQAWQHGKCSKEDSECFDSHCNPPLRRKPHLQHGRFNYIPTRCRYLTEKEECPQTIHCRFAHCTEEVIYHPSKFRTQLCQNGLDSRGICEGYGFHCAKAHSEADLRSAVFETMDNPACLYMTMDELSDFVCAAKDRHEEQQFYMYVYKTRRCEGYPYNCECDGLDFHRGHERRRSGVIKYLPMACPNIKPFPKSEWGDPYDDSKCVPVNKLKKDRNRRDSLGENCDEEIWDCQYAHTLMEVMYHPQVYKTDLCQHFDENDPINWRCVWKKRCAHAHGKADMRTKEEAVQEWKIHMGDLFKGRKLPSLVEQIIAAPSMSIGKDSHSSELFKAFAEEFNLRGLEDSKHLQISPPASRGKNHNSNRNNQAKHFDFADQNPNDSINKSNLPLHNVHVRQSSQRSAPRRLSLPLPPSQQRSNTQQQQELMHKDKNEQSQQRDSRSVPPPPPPRKQQLPSIPPEKSGDFFSLAQKKNINDIESSASQSSSSNCEKHSPFLVLPPPPRRHALHSSPQLPPAPPPTPNFQLLPISPSHSDPLHSRSLSNYSNTIAPSDVLFANRRGSSALEILEATNEPNKTNVNEEVKWKTPRPIEPQRLPSTKQKWLPLFDLGASTWSSPGLAPVLPRFRSLAEEGGSLTGLRPEEAQKTSSEPQVEELENSLCCPFGESIPHLLAEAAITPCCGLSFCRNCINMYLEAVDGAIGWPLRCVELKDKYPSEIDSDYVERESGRCICGHWVKGEEIDLMSQAGRSNFTVDSFLEITRRYSQ